jgi:hypothetical protein
MHVMTKATWQTNSYSVSTLETRRSFNPGPCRLDSRIQASPTTLLCSSSFSCRSFSRSVDCSRLTGMPVQRETTCAISSGPTSSDSMGSFGICAILDLMACSMSASAPYLQYSKAYVNNPAEPPRGSLRSSGNAAFPACVVWSALPRNQDPPQTPGKVQCHLTVSGTVLPDLTYKESPSQWQYT